MTSPVPVNVKGQGKARGRRRRRGDGAAGDDSGPPERRPRAPDEEAASEAALVGAPRPGDADSAAPEAGAPEEPWVPPERRTEPDATGRWDVIAGDDDLEASAPGPRNERSTPAATRAAVNPAAATRAAARERRAQEQADQAAEIEAAALAESPRRSRRRQRDRTRPEVDSRGSRRQQRALERMAAAAAGAAAHGDSLVQESRRERRARDQAQSLDGAKGGTRRQRKARKRQLEAADEAGTEQAAVIGAEHPPAPGAGDGTEVGVPAPAEDGLTVTGALTAAAAAGAGAPEPEPAPDAPLRAAKVRSEPSPGGDAEPGVEPRPDAELDSDQPNAPVLTDRLREGVRWLDRVGGVVPPPAPPAPPGEPAGAEPPAGPEPPASPAAPARGEPTPRQERVRTAPLPPGPTADTASGGPAARGPSGPRPDRTRHRPPAPKPPSEKHVPRAVVLRQRRRRRRTLIGTTILLVVVNLLVGGAYVYFQWRLDQINRVAVGGLADDAPGEVMNVLLVGSDSRERLEGADAAQAGKDLVAGRRSDTIMVLHVDPRQQRAAILAVPRDLYVPIPGTDGSDRVNTAFAIGGAERLIGALSGIGIQVNHYAEVDFVGFKEIVDAIGGVPVFVPAPSRDTMSSLAVGAGCTNFDGDLALAYVRSRQFESLVDGNWVADPRGDLGRIERQQDFIRRVMKKGVSAGISNPFALNRLIGIGVRNLTIDETMSTSDIASLARRFRSVDPDSVETLVLPTAPQTIDGQEVLVLQDQEAQDEIAKVNGSAPLAPPPSEPGATGPTPPDSATPVSPGDVRVQVLNGNGTKGVAKQTADALRTAGFEVVGTDDTAIIRRTIVRHATGQEAEARLVAAGLKAGGDLQVDARLSTADVALVLGADYEGYGAPGATPSTVAGGTPEPVTTPSQPPC